MGSIRSVRTTPCRHDSTSVASPLAGIAQTFKPQNKLINLKIKCFIIQTCTYGVGKTWPAGLIRSENTLNQACGNIRQQIDSVTVKDHGNENLKQVEALHMHNIFFYWHYNPLSVLAFSVILFHSALSSHCFLHCLNPNYLHIFFNVYNPSLLWSSSNSRTYRFPLSYSPRCSLVIHPHHVTWPSYSSAFYKSHYVCIFH